MKKLFALLALTGSLLIISPSLKAQEQTNCAGRMLYSELGGPGVVMSLNWDARFKSHARLGFGYRVGVGVGIGDVEVEHGEYYSETRTRAYYTIPVGVNYVLGKPGTASTFEVGASATFLTRKVSLYDYDEDKRGHFIGTLAFMYRIIPENGGFAFRVGFTPMIGTAGDFFPMAAISFGYAF